MKKAKRKTKTKQELKPVPSALKAAVYEFVKTWTDSVTGFVSPPGPIYHYCDANALLNIFRNKSLWATGTRYLNDASEHVSVLRNLPRTLKKHAQTRTGKILVDAAEVIRTHGANLLSNAIGMEFYVSCFSEDPDILSQWRSYADDGLGFAIGFDTKKLKLLNATGSEPAHLRRMIYAGAEEQQLIDSLFNGLGSRIEPFLGVLDKTGWTYEDGRNSTAREWLSIRVSECLMELAFRCKDESFREEKEWRIQASSGPTQFRSSRGRILPYKLLDMTSADNDQLMPIERVMMGPNAERLDTERVLMYLAEEYGYGHMGFDITKSKAPYR